MARATNDLTNGLSGKVGGLVFRQQADGSPAVVAAAPTTTRRKPHPLEAVNQQNFKRATDYGNLVKCDRALKQRYAARRTAKLRSAYHVALADARNPPQVRGYSAPPAPLRPGYRLGVEATDDFEVVRVAVQLEAPDGRLLEAGEAVLPAEGAAADWWHYTVQGPVEAGSWLVATAYDRPGNATTARWVLA